MKIFCNCNSEWIVTGTLPYGCGGPSQTIPPKGSETCWRCMYNGWYNPQYENMMHDLKEMNQ